MSRVYQLENADMSSFVALSEGAETSRVPGTSYMVAVAQPCGHCGQRCMCVYGTRNAVLGSTGALI